MSYELLLYRSPISRAEIFVCESLTFRSRKTTPTIYFLLTVFVCVFLCVIAPSYQWLMSDFTALQLLTGASQHLACISITQAGGGLQDGRGVRRGDHLPPHKYIKSTSTCGTAPTEHPLNAGRRLQTSQKARKSPNTWVGQKKKEKTETKE